MECIVIPTSNFFPNTSFSTKEITCCIPANGFHVHLLWDLLSISPFHHTDGSWDIVTSYNKSQISCASWCMSESENEEMHLLASIFLEIASFNLFSQHHWTRIQFSLYCFCSLPTFSGSPVYLNYSFGWVNVKDVALAHVLAFETPSASGRYGMVDKVMHFSQVVKIIKDMYPSLPVPDK